MKTESNIVEEHPSHGLPYCSLADLPAELDRIISETKKTPLILDPSAEQQAASFFNYKARMEVEYKILCCS
jgi:hypothetical protein